MKERPFDETIEEMRRKARERIVGVIEKFRDEPNLVINIEEDKETSETITLELIISDPSGKESKVYHKGFMKVLKLPNGLSIEEAVENEIRFPEENIKKI